MSDVSRRLTIKELVEQSYRNAEQHGFWDDERTTETVPSKLALIMSEAGEALESYRDPNSDNLVPVPAELVERLLDEGNEAQESHPFEDLAALYRKWLEKPKGFDIELADTVIRIADLAGSLGIDLERAITTKHAYNVTRPMRHNRIV